jgi:two-component system, cell cycle sensor histidine kinase and response regulator CckA
VTGGGKILVVDDSRESLKVLSEILGSEGYDVRPADSGELALLAVTVSPPELVLLDLRMPGMSGLEVCRELKSRVGSQDIPVILLSSSHDFEDRLEGLESGAVDFLDKPFRREELLTRLKTHLELARLRKDLERRVVERTAALQTANQRLKSELEARMRMEEELRESEYRFRSIADTAPAGICLFSQQGLPTYASKWVLTFLGITLEQLVSGGWIGAIHPEDRRRLLEEVASADREQRSSQIEHRLLRYDGEYRWVASTANPRFLHDEFVGHIVILVEITELKRSQQEAMANQKLESLGVLSAGIAHVFNNSLSTILANADLALDEIADESPLRENISTIATVALRASKIVRLLLAYAGHSDSGTLELIDLSSLIEETVQLLQVTCPRNTSLRLNLAKHVPPIWANAGQLRQVILNLILNGSEALEAQAGTVTVSASAVRVSKQSAEPAPPDLGEGDYVLIEVSDTGCGMTQDTRARIFDPFFTTKFLGRGLGLASVQGIVRAAGGAIDVMSTPGQGSTIRVWLPSSDRLAETAGMPRVPSNPAGTVLLVDDEDGLRRAVASALKKEGFSVLEARDGSVAVQLFAKHSSEIDIVVLDMVLPGLSGREVYDEIRLTRKDLPVLFCSARDFTGRDEPDTATNQSFLAKPFRLGELIETLRKMMASQDLPISNKKNQSS